MLLTDYVKRLHQRLDAAIVHNSVMMGQEVKPQETYAHMVGLNNGLRQAAQLAYDLANELANEDGEPAKALGRRVTPKEAEKIVAANGADE